MTKLELKTFINQHKNGKEMYDRNIYFRSACDAIINGQNKYHIIKDLCKIIEEQQIEIDKIKLNNPHPTFKINK